MAAGRQVRVMFTPEEIAQIDTVRGTIRRSRWTTAALVEALGMPKRGAELPTARPAGNRRSERSGVLLQPEVFERLQEVAGSASYGDMARELILRVAQNALQGAPRRS